LPSLVVVSRYDPRRGSRYLLSKQWVSLTREITLKFPLTASIQAEFIIRAGVPVNQQSCARCDSDTGFKDPKEQISLLQTGLQLICHRIKHGTKATKVTD
jgi:hypothetical protein